MQTIAKGRLVTVRHTLVDSPVGILTVAAHGPAVAGIYFERHRHPPRPESLGVPVPAAEDDVLNEAARQLAEYFEGSRTSFDLPLAPTGPKFHTRVWDRLRRIGYGDRTTYGTIAAEFGDPKLARAVGTAVGRNPISIAVPCHRVVGSSGRLTGFAGGLDRKAWLLRHEGIGDAALF